MIGNDVGGAALAGGQTRSAEVQPLGLTPLEELKRLLPGSILWLGDGTIVFVPFKRGVVAKPGEDSFRVTTCDKVGGPGGEKDPAWLEQHVKLVVVGVLTLPSGTGCFADQVAMGGVKVKLGLEDTAPLANVTVALGSQVKVLGFEAAVTALGLAARPWGGGTQTSALVTGGDLPTLAEAKVAPFLPVCHPLWWAKRASRFAHRSAGGAGRDGRRRRPLV